MELIRLAQRQPSVAAAIHAVLQEAYAVEAELLGAQDFPPLRRTTAAIAASDTTFLGCRRAGELVGVVEVEDAGRAPHIASLGVRSTCFRQGVGSWMVCAVLRALAAETVTVSTAAANVPAVRLYRRAGFEVDGRWSTPDGCGMVTLRWRRGGRPTVRRLGPADTEALLAVRREALAGEPAAFSGSPETDMALDPGRVRGWLADPSAQVVLGAFDAGELAGMAGVYREAGAKLCHKAVLWGMFVRPAWRGRGAARDLVAAAIAAARSLRGVTHVHLSVGDEAAAARRLYQRAGFVAWGTEPAALIVDGVPVDQTHMVLDLRQAAAREHDELVRFIRGTLGCGCPEEVVAAARVEPAPPGWVALGVERVVDVGGRLLVALMTGATPAAAAAVLPELVAAGRRRRDEGGFNRLRIVLAPGGSAADGAGSAAPSDDVAGGDERIHLHVLERAELPVALR